MGQSTAPPTAQTAGSLLREARTRAGLSQVELAARAGVTQSVISAYESGRRQPALPTLVDLVHATGLDLVVEVRSPLHGRPLQVDGLDQPAGIRQRRERGGRARQ